MDKFSTKANGDAFSIDKQTYENRTLKRFPFVQKRSDGTFMHYALCYHCYTPIEIVNLYPRGNSLIQPYGRHVGHAIPGLGNFDVLEMWNCPEYHPRPDERPPRRGPESKYSQEIKRLLEGNIEKVRKFVQANLDFFVTDRLFQQMLKNYIEQKAWQYGTKLNYPMVFLCFANSIALGNRIVKKESQLFQLLSGKNNKFAVALEGQRVICNPFDTLSVVAQSNDRNHRGNTFTLKYNIRIHSVNEYQVVLTKEITINQDVILRWGCGDPCPQSLEVILQDLIQKNKKVDLVSKKLKK